MRLLFVLFALVCAPAAYASSIVGRAEIIDGDSLRIAGTEIRLHGVDAFERGQRCGELACGREATAMLRRLAASGDVSCTRKDVDRYGRTVAKCRVGETDVAAALVRAGWAMAFRRYSLEYVVAEQTARAAKVGAWASGDVTPPWSWRSRRREGA